MTRPAGVSREQLLSDPVSGARPLSIDRTRHLAPPPPEPEQERESESESTRRFQSEAIANALVLTCQRARQAAHDGDFETARECLDRARGWDNGAGTVLPETARYVEAAQAGEEWTRHLAPPPQRPWQERESDDLRRSHSARVMNARMWACRNARQAAHDGDFTAAHEWLDKARGWDKGNGEVLPNTERYVEAAQAGEEWTADPKWIKWESPYYNPLIPPPRQADREIAANRPAKSPQAERGAKQYEYEYE